MSADSVTILRSHGRLATKRVRCDAGGNVSIEPYSDAKNWSVRQAPIASFGDLVDVLEEVAADPRACIIRGEPIEGFNENRCRRLLHTCRETGHPPTFRDQPRHWLLLDFDGTEPNPIGDQLDGERQATGLGLRLPPCFHGVSCWWSFTSSAGLPGKSGLRMRLGYWLDRAVGGEELARWFSGYPVDYALFRAVQCHYVARPVFIGMRDPLERRSGVAWNSRDMVAVPQLPAEETEPTRATQDFNCAGNLARLYPGGFRARPLITFTPNEILEDACAKVARAPAGGINLYGHAGRHNALFCAGLRLSSLISEGRILRRTVIAELTAAAEAAGLKGERDIVPHIERGLAQGGAR